MIIEKIVVGQFETNCYLIGCENTKKAVIIDPGAEFETINKVIVDIGLKPEFVINTHGHVDHFLENDKFALPVYIHRLDSSFLKDTIRNLSVLFGFSYIYNGKIEFLEEGKTFEIGEIKLKTIHTPGHTPGSICLFDEVKKIIFTGDTLFAYGFGRTDFPEGSEEILLKSIKEKLLILPEETVIYPGHGPSCNIKKVKEWFSGI